MCVLKNSSTRKIPEKVENTKLWSKTKIIKVITTFQEKNFLSSRNFLSKRYFFSKTTTLLNFKIFLSLREKKFDVRCARTLFLLDISNYIQVALHIFSSNIYPLVTLINWGEIFLVKNENLFNQFFCTVIAQWILKLDIKKKILSV